MEKEIVAGALFLLAFISPTPASPSLGGPTPPLQTSQVKQKEMTVYAVQKEDTLRSIAEKYYGSGDYWTNIWNSNSWIENPNIIEKGWKLTIKDKSDKPEELKKELFEKLDQDKTFYVSAVEIRKDQTLSGFLNETQINFLGNCESGMRPATNTGNGFYGAFQFTIGTWNSMRTGYERADLAPLETQTEATQRLLSRSSIWTQFPGCAAKMRNAGLL